MAGAWLVPRQRTPSSEALLNNAHRHEFEAPHIFPVEVRNLLLSLERRGRLDAADTAQAIANLAAYGVLVDAPPDQAEYDTILTLARGEILTVYDALYLWQAMRDGVDLASQDSALLEAATRNGVSVLDLRG